MSIICSSEINLVRHVPKNENDQIDCMIRESGVDDIYGGGTGMEMELGEL